MLRFSTGIVMCILLTASATPALATESTKETTPAAAPADNVQMLEIEVHPLILPGRVLLTWSTAQESANLGFYVYGAEEDPNGELVKGEKLTPAPIPAVVPGELGGDYEFIDERVGGTERVERKYYIEQVDMGGGTTLHGPVGFGMVNSSVEDWSAY